MRAKLRRATRPSGRRTQNHMTIPDAAPPPSRGRDVLVEFPQDELIAKWEEFFEEMGYLSKIIAVADRYPEERSLAVAFDELNRFDTDMAIYLLRHPLNVLNAGEEAIRRLVPPGEEPALIHLRVRALPRDRRIPIRDLRAKHLGQYIAVEGLVRKSTEVRPRVTDALFQCLRCGTIIKEPQDGQNFREPLECYEEQGGCKRSASATKFKLLTETSLYLDTQKIEVQESPEGLRGGEEPQRLSAYVEDDLTGRITPGQRVILNGVLRSVQRGRPGQRSTLFDIFVDVNSVEMERVEFEEIEVTEEDAHRIREIGSSPDIFRLITASIAPSIYGMHVEKEALALQLFGGVAKIMPDGRRIRGDIHLILVGDPGTGKSELLSYMIRLSPRGIYATGKAASAAGLTAAAVRDEFGEGRWTLEAGALVLADLGLAAIDEIEKMNPQDRSAIHEAMEQQRISVAKAGITAVLQSRCAILAAANPKFGRFDEHKYISEQIDLPPALLSRFDIIFSIIDRPQADRDRELAEHILKGHKVGEIRRRREAGGAEDAERAVRIVEYWMGKVAGEEGRFDIDIIQTGISQSQREQIISIRDIINELAGPEGVADYEDIVRIAQERGIPPAKVDAWLKRWAQEGEIYSPAKNKYKLVERL